jgi:sensor histidine kinase YesM
MTRKKCINQLNWKTALSLSFIISLFINILNIFVRMLSERFFDFDTSNLLMKTGSLLLVSTFVLFLLYLFAFKAIQLPLKPHKKAFIVIIGCFLLSVGVGTILFLIMMWIKEFEVRAFGIVLQIINNFILAIVVWLTTSQLYVNQLRQQTMLENERLIAENIRNRYEALKNQIDPHFLFNSLNTLNGLIGFDNERAREYVEKLSSVFRYTIQNKGITTLQEELDFTNSYAYLMKIRYGENFEIEHGISEKYLSYYIMPISIQLLIENAIKHNVISNKYPLTVRIYTTEQDILVVENAIRAKEFAAPSSGIGLANLCERYKLLFQKEVVIINSTDNTFRVEIPLIESEMSNLKLLKENESSNH